MDGFVTAAVVLCAIVESFVVITAVWFISTELKSKSLMSLITNKFQCGVAVMGICYSIFGLFNTLWISCFGQSKITDAAIVAISGIFLAIGMCSHVFCLNLRVTALPIPKYFKLPLNVSWYVLPICCLLTITAYIANAVMVSQSSDAQSVNVCFGKSTSDWVGWSLLLFGSAEIIVDVICGICFIGYVVKAKKRLGSEAVTVTEIIAWEGTKITMATIVTNIGYAGYFMLSKNSFGALFQTVYQLGLSLIFFFWVEMKTRIDSAQSRRSTMIPPNTTIKASPTTGVVPSAIVSTATDEA
jgi:hypothetical protein